MNNYFKFILIIPFFPFLVLVEFLTLLSGVLADAFNLRSSKKSNDLDLLELDENLNSKLGLSAYAQDKIGSFASALAMPFVLLILLISLLADVLKK